MKKHLLLSFIAVASITFAFAQPTITVANFPFVEKVRYQPADSSTVPGFDTTANSFWDLGSIQKKGAIEIDYYTQISNHPVFTTANEVSDVAASFGPLTFRQNVYAEKSASGYISQGIGYEQQKKGIGFLSGNNNDTIEVIQQTFPFVLPYTEVSFPLTTNTKWVTATRAETDMLFTIALVGYNKTPAKLVNYFTANHEVISHGTCRVPAKGSPGQTFDALLVKSELLRVDSFYIDGQQPNPFLLAAIDIDQADTTITYQYSIYRENGGLQKLAEIDFEDNSYTTIDNARYSAEFDVVSVGELSISNNLVVYPNPVTQNAFTVYTTAKNPKFTVTDMAGKAIAIETEVLGTNNYKIKLPQQLSKGIYFLQSADNTKNATIKLLVK